MNLNNCIIFFIFLLIIYLLYKKQEDSESFNNTCNTEAIPCSIIDCQDGKIKAQVIGTSDLCKCCDTEIKNESDKELILYYSFDQYTINSNNEMINLAESTVKYNAQLNNVNIISDSIIGTNSIEFNQKSFININQFNLSSNKFTISLWLNRTGTVANRSILNLNNNIYIQDMISYVLLGINSRYGTITYNFYDVGNYKNNWCHLVWVSNGNTWTLYLNNKKTVINNKFSIDENISFVNNKIGNGFTGIMDDFKLYNSELTDNDITELYNLGKNNVTEIKNNNIELELPNDYVFINNSLINTNIVTNANRIGVTSKNPIVGPCFLSFNPPPHLCYIGFSEYPFEVKGIRYGCTHSGGVVNFFTPIGPSNTFICSENDPEITIKLIYDGTKMIYYANNQIIFSIERKINEPLYIVASTYYERQMINNINFGSYTESSAPILSSAPSINNLNSDSSLVYLLTFEKNTFDNTNKKILNVVKNGLNANINGDIYYSIDDNVDVLQLNSIKNQYITLDNFKINQKNGITISFWFKGTNSNGWSRIIDWGLVTNTNNIIIAIDNNTKFNFGTWHHPNALNQNIQLTNFNHEWIHFTWSMNPITKKWNVYLNGLLIKTLNNTIFPFDIQRKLFIGRSQTGHESNLNGFLTDFRVYNRVLNDNEINIIFTSHKLNNIIKVFKNLNYNQNKILLYLASQVTSPDATLKAIENDAIINLDISNNTIINKTTNVPLSSAVANAVKPAGEVILLDSALENVTIVNNKVSAWKNFVQTTDVSRPIIKNNLIDFSNSISIGLTQTETPVTTSVLTLTFVFKLTLLSTNIKTLVITNGQWVANNINLMINNRQFVISIGSAGDYYTPFFPVIDTMYILSVIINSSATETTSRFRVNGQEYNSYTHSGKSLQLNNRWDLGFWSGTRGFTGGIGNIIQYNKLLTKTEHESLEGFLANRWNMNTLLSPEHPFYVKPLLSVTKYGDIILTKQTMEFKRLEDYIKIVPFKINSNGLSFSFWYKTSGTPSMSKIFDFGNGPNNKNMCIAITNNINLLFIVNGTTPSQVSLPIVKFNNWVHICWTLDPIQNKWLIYENGQLSITYDGYYPEIINREYNYIGKSIAADPLFSGSIDDFRMYYKVINQSDVQILYNQQNLSYLNDDESLVLHYTFENQNNQIIRNNGKNDYNVNYEITNKGFNDFVINNYLVSDSLNKVSTSFSSPSIIQSGELEVGNNALSTPLSVKPFTPTINSITIAYWFKSNKSPNNTFIFDFNGAIIMYINNNQLWCGVSGSNMVFFNTNINDNIWRHVVWIINNNKWEFYINSELINTVTSNIKYPPLGVLNSNILAKTGFIGSINDFRVYNRLLTSDEFKNLYNLQKLSDTSDTSSYTEVTFVPRIDQSNSVNGYTASTSSVYANNNNFTGPWNAFDQNINTWWHSNEGTNYLYNGNTGIYTGITETTIKSVVGVVKGEWLQINTPKPIVLTRYEIQGRQGCCGNPNGRDPNTWYILGFKDGEWYQVDYQTNISFNFNMLSFNISNPAPYTAYRIVITVCGDNKATPGQRITVQIGQWNLFNSNNPTLYIAPISKTKTSNYKVGLLPLTFSSVKSEFITCEKYRPVQTGITFAFWFKSNATQTWGRIFDFGNGANVNNILVAIQSNRLWFDIRDSRSGSSEHLPGNINDNVWRHIVWIVKPTTPIASTPATPVTPVNTTWEIYLNEVLVSTRENMKYPANIELNNNYIGRSNWSQDPYYNGSIDDFRVYHKILNSTEISNLYNLNNYVTTEDNLIMLKNPLMQLENGFATFTASDKNFISVDSLSTNNNGLAISFFFKSFNSENYSRIIDFGNGKASDNIIIGINNNKLFVSVFKIINDDIINTTWDSFYDVNINDGVTRHFVWTMLSNDEWSIYINGQKINTKTNGLYPTSLNRNKNFIGKSNWLADPYFNGQIDNFIILNRSLSSTDIGNLYNQTLVSDDSLILNLNFERVAKEYIRNNSSSHLNGIVNIENINNFITLNSNNKEFINIKPFKINNYGLTFSLWFKTSSTRGGLFDFGNGQNFNNISIELNNNNLVFFVAGVASHPINFNRMNINEWIHVVWVLSSVDNKWKIYKNGVLINSIIANYPEIITRNQNYIGKLNNNLFFDGSITYFKLYNKCLTNNDILSLYNQE
jgi:hypothetical protein